MEKENHRACVSMCLCERVCMRVREGEKEEWYGWILKGIHGHISRPQDIYNWMRNAPQRTTAASQECHLLLDAPGAHHFLTNHFTEAYSLGGLVRVDY